MNNIENNTTQVNQESKLPSAPNPSWCGLDGAKSKICSKNQKRNKRKAQKKLFASQPGQPNVRSLRKRSVKRLIEKLKKRYTFLCKIKSENENNQKQSAQLTGYIKFEPIQDDRLLNLKFKINKTQLKLHSLLNSLED